MLRKGLFTKSRIIEKYELNSTCFLLIIINGNKNYLIKVKAQ